MIPGTQEPKKTNEKKLWKQTWDWQFPGVSGDAGSGWRGVKGYTLVISDKKKMLSCPKLSDGGADVKVTRDGPGGSCGQLMADATSWTWPGALDELQAAAREAAAATPPCRHRTFGTAAHSRSKTWPVSSCGAVNWLPEFVIKLIVKLFDFSSKKQPLDLYFLNLNLLVWQWLIKLYGFQVYISNPQNFAFIFISGCVYVYVCVRTCC